jgi:hypothetical protein
VVRSRKIVSVFVIVTLLAGFLVSCQHRIPKDALALSPTSLADRQLQTRVFETSDEKMLLTASAALLQDLGFTIEESEVPCGLIVCSRDRDLTDAGQVVGRVFLAAFTGVLIPWDEKQKVFASLVTKPLNDEKIAVRITFQHMVWNSSGQLVKNEQMNDPEVYQEFFSKLSKSVFLVAQEI